MNDTTALRQSYSEALLRLSTATSHAMKMGQKYGNRSPERRRALASEKRAQADLDAVSEKRREEETRHKRARRQAARRARRRTQKAKT